MGCHLPNKSVRHISDLLELPLSTVSAVIVKWKTLGATTTQLRSGRPHKLTERDPRVIKSSVLGRNKHNTEFQTASGNISTRTVRRELHEMGFHGRAATHKPNLTMRNAKPRLEWCKARRH
jgi:transposase